jgi:hypothetical protein
MLNIASITRPVIKIILRQRTRIRVKPRHQGCLEAVSKTAVINKTKSRGGLSKNGNEMP